MTLKKLNYMKTKINAALLVQSIFQFHYNSLSRHTSNVITWIPLMPSRFLLLLTTKTASSTSTLTVHMRLTRLYFFIPVFSRVHARVAATQLELVCDV